MTAYGTDVKPKAETDKPNDQSEVTLAWLKRCFETAEDTTMNSRALAEKCRDYFDSKQLTPEEDKALRKRGQPPVIINRIKRKISYVVGLEIRKRSTPKAYPRTPKHEQDADGATQALRYAAERVHFKKTKTAVMKEMLIEGGPTGCYIGVEKVKDRVEVTVQQIPWDRCFADPHSREPDYSDATYKGFITWLDEVEAKRRFPDGSEVIEATVTDAVANSKTYDDRPRSQKWVDTKRKRLRIVEVYYDNGAGWECATFTESGFLKEPHPVDYIDQDGLAECPLELVSANVDRENQRYGEVVELIDLQDEINKRRSKSLHLLTMRQSRFGRGVKDPDKQSSELAKPDGKVIADKDEFEILPTGDMARGQMELLAQATQEMDGAGANASLQGKGPDAASGRAILANQQGGQIELEPLMDELAFWELRVYRQIWNRIRQYWTGEMWVRVTDDERNMRWVGLNKPMTNGEFAERQGMDPKEMEQSGIDPNALYVDPNTGQPVIANNVAELEVDIILDRGPDTVTLEQEQFDTLAKIPGVPPDLLIEASSLRNKDQILDRLTGKTGPGGKEAPPPPPPPEVIKAQADAAEKGKDRELQTSMAIGERQAEDKRTAETNALAKEKLATDVQLARETLAATERKNQSDAAIRNMELILESRKLRIQEFQLGLSHKAHELDTASLALDAHNAEADREVALAGHEAKANQQKAAKAA